MTFMTFADSSRQASRSWEIIKNWGGLQSDPDAENLLAKTPQNAIALRMDLSLTFRHFLWWLKPAVRRPHPLL